MIKIARFNLKVLLKRKAFLNMLLLTPVIAFYITYSTNISNKELFYQGNVIYSSFFFNNHYNGLMNLFIVGLPLICSLFYGDYYYYEKSFLHEILVRGKHKAYYFITNGILAFVYGFIIIAVFLGSLFLFNYLITINPEHTLSWLSLNINENQPSNGWWMSQIFYEQPYLYIAIKSLFICLFAGCLSLTTYSVSLFVKAKIIAYMIPMALTIGLAMFFAFVIAEYGNWQSMMVFNPHQIIVKQHELAVLFWYMLLLGSSSILIFIKCRKEILS